MGFAISASSIAYSLYLAFVRIFCPQNQIVGWTSIVVAIGLLGGIQLIGIGLLGEYMLRIYEEVKRRPLYVLDKAIGFENQDAKPA
jgi:polyisoprenyl-phosphate glycosyltransferase